MELLLVVPLLVELPLVVPLLVELPLVVRRHRLALVLQHQLVELLLVWLKHPRLVLLLELHPL